MKQNSVVSTIEKDDALATTWVNGASFWYPNFIADSAWIEHGPFAFWIASILKPRTFVELGTHGGYSYFAFCQAVKALGLDTRCYAVDTWKGDEHAGRYGEEVFHHVQAYNETHYGPFSRLVRSTFDEALGHFSDACIDLLHIDGRHFYEDVKHDFESWRPKLSDRGVVLFHDTNVRERNFGVFRLWEELKEAFPAFEFLHGHGLGVLGYGARLPSAITAFFETTASPAVATEVRAAYGRLGAAVQADYLARHDHAQLGAELQARAAEAAALAAKLEARDTEAAALAAKLEARDIEAAALEAKLEVHDAKAGALEAKLAAQTARASDLTLMLQACDAQLAALQASTSWRITAPMRRFGTASPFVARNGRRLMKATWWLGTGQFWRIADAVRARRAARQVAARGDYGPEALAVIERGTGAEASGPAAGVRCRVAWIGGEPDTPGYRYRVLRWAEAARAAGAEVADMRLDEAPHRLADIRAADVVIIWRAAWDPIVRQVVSEARAGGARLVFDVDDLMIDPDLARIDVIDGIRSQFLAERDVQQFYGRVRHTMALADICTATTEELAAQFRLLFKPALVLPNGYDTATFQASRLAVRRRASRAGDGLLRIGYAGGSRTHQRDFAACADAVGRILRERPKVRLVVFEDQKAGLQLLDPAEFPALRGLEDRLEWRARVPLEELPEEVARFDVNLAPLEVGNPFCESKSELKYFEGALAGVCTVASPTGPYRRAIRDGETGFLAESEQDWHDAICRLLDDADLRSRMACAALHDVLWTFGPERRVEMIDTALDQFRGGRAAARAFAVDLGRSTASRPAMQPIPDSETIFASDALRVSDVTVVVPLHNYAGYVVEALDSVAAQTVQDLDLIVVDDASTDNSLEVATAWAKAHSARFNRLLVLRNRVNSKLGPTRNVGFNAAETPYVLPLDADNRLLPQCVERCLTVIRPAGAAFAYPVIRQFGAMSQLMGNFPFDPVRFVGGNFIDAMALIAKSAWCAVGGYHNVVYGWEDYDFWCRLAELGLAGISVGGEPAAEYRVHAASMLRTVTEIDDNKRKLVEDIEQRHPWISVAYRKGPAAAANQVSFAGTGTAAERLDRILPLLRCPETGQALKRQGQDALCTEDGSRVWPLVHGRPVLFPGLTTPELRSEGHVSNAVPLEVIERMRATPGPVLNLSAGGTAERLDNVIEAEVAIFRHTDIAADAHCLPFADDCLDGVVALNAFEHYHNPRCAALEIMRVLKPGGWVLIRTAFLQPQHEAPWHFYNCTKHGLLRWFDGFETEALRVSENFNPSYALSWIAADCEAALRRDVSAGAADRFSSTPVGDFVRFWRDEAARSSPVWAAFRELSQESQEGIAAGFEYVAHKPQLCPPRRRPVTIERAG